MEVRFRGFLVLQQVESFDLNGFLGIFDTRFMMGNVFLWLRGQGTSVPEPKEPSPWLWNSGKYRYFDNLWMAQILQDIVSLKSDPKERELAQQFFEHFCKMNQIRDHELPKPNGALMRI